MNGEQKRKDKLEGGAWIDEPYWADDERGAWWPRSGFDKNCVDKALEKIWREERENSKH